MTLLDSRLLSEYAFQRMAGAVTGLASRDFEYKDASRIDKIEVIWPNGSTQTFENVAADRFYHLTQGATLATGKESQHAPPTTH